MLKANDGSAEPNNSPMAGGTKLEANENSGLGNNGGVVNNNSYSEARDRTIYDNNGLVINKNIFNILFNKLYLTIKTFYNKYLLL